MENDKYIPVRAFAEPCAVECDSAGNCYCPTDQTFQGNQERDPDAPRVPDNDVFQDRDDYWNNRQEGGYSNRFTNTTPDDPNNAPEIDYNADARRWPTEPKFNYDANAPYDPAPQSDSYNRAEPYRGYQGSDPRALNVDAKTGKLYPAANQDAYGNPNYGTTGGWNSDFSGRGGSGGGYTDFSGTARA
jgi:hypothetical protein